MKVTCGEAIKNPDTGVERVIFDTAPLLKPYDYIIGGVLVVSGVAYMLVRSFKNGCKAYCIANYKTLKELGLTD